MRASSVGQSLSIYSDEEGALNSKKLQAFFKEEGITHVIKDACKSGRNDDTHGQKMIGDRLRHYKTKTWVEVLKPSLNKYNNQVSLR